MPMRDLSHQAGRAVADAVACYALGLILTPYSVHAADGTTLACLSCPIDAHQEMRRNPAAVEWRNAEGVTCGRKVRKASYLPRTDRQCGPTGASRLLSPNWGGLIA